MTELENIVKNTYNNLTKPYNDLISHCKTEDININIISDNYGDKTIEVFCKNTKIISAKYDVLGVYDDQLNLFTWGWNVELIDKNIIKNTKKIKKQTKSIKSDIIKRKYSDIGYMEKILYYISNNIFFISKDNITGLLEYCVYITQTKGIIKQVTKAQNSKNKLITIYYLVTDIIGT